MSPKMHCALLPITLASFVVASSSVQAARIAIGGVDSNGVTLITVSGKFEPEDGERFKKVAQEVSDAVVTLESKGGATLAGLSIGSTMRSKGFTAVVPNAGSCASACGLAWLGGKVRIIGRGARVGFHAAYRIVNGRAVETGSGNALVGAYLARLNLSDEAVYFVTQAPPQGIRWLRKSDADAMNVAVTEESFDLGRFSTKLAKRTPPDPKAPKVMPKLAMPSLPAPIDYLRPAPADGTNPVVANSEKTRTRCGRGETTPQVNNEPQGTVGRAVLYEEDTGNPQQPRAFPGRVVWRLEGVNAGQGQPLEPAVRAVVEVPDAGMVLKLLLRCNRDATLPASHTIELSFATRPGDAGRAVRDVGLPQFKNEEAARGTPVAGLPVPVRENLILIGLSNLQADIERNLDLIARRNWIDLPVRMASGQRAIVSLEKGPTGEQVINDAVRQWRVDPPSSLSQSSLRLCPADQAVYRREDGALLVGERVGTSLPSTDILTGSLDGSRVFLVKRLGEALTSYSAADYPGFPEVSWKRGNAPAAEDFTSIAIRAGPLSGKWIVAGCRANPREGITSLCPAGGAGSGGTKGARLTAGAGLRDTARIEELLTPCGPNLTTLSRVAPSEGDPLVETRVAVIQPANSLDQTLIDQNVGRDQVAAIKAALTPVLMDGGTEEIRLELLIAPGPRPGDGRQVVRVRVYRGSNLLGAAAVNDRAQFLFVPPDTGRQSEALRGTPELQAVTESADSALGRMRRQFPQLRL